MPHVNRPQLPRVRIDCFAIAGLVDEKAGDDWQNQAEDVKRELSSW